MGTDADFISLVIESLIQVANMDLNIYTDI